jgi:tRNA threonylcarbamoyladenosine biosynthesis protein TsaE
MPTITSASPEETRTLGAELGSKLATGDLVCLEGHLGAGTTTFVQGLVFGWGSTDRVTSPTFVLVNEYRRAGGERLYHMDACRLSGPAEAEDLDVDALLAAGPLIVEWADRIRAALPQPAATVTFADLGGERRRIVIRRGLPAHAPRR